MISLIWRIKQDWKAFQSHRLHNDWQIWILLERPDQYQSSKYQPFTYVQSMRYKRLFIFDITAFREDFTPLYISDFVGFEALEEPWKIKVVWRSLFFATSTAFITSKMHDLMKFGSFIHHSKWNLKLQIWYQLTESPVLLAMFCCCSTMPKARGESESATQSAKAFNHRHVDTHVCFIEEWILEAKTDCSAKDRLFFASFAFCVEPIMI